MITLPPCHLATLPPCAIDERQRRPAAFLDRDGVLNVDTGYVIDTAKAQLIDGAAKAVQALNEAGYLVIVVSNQLGVARGYFDNDAVRKFNNWLAEELSLLNARIDAFYFCPHHPKFVDDHQSGRCDCRKPKPGLLHRAAKDWSVDLKHSFLIGDRSSDIAAANAAGIPGFLFNSGDLAEFIEKLPFKKTIDHHAENLTRSVNIF